MGKCKLCGRQSIVISDVLGVCVDCIRSRWGEAKKLVELVHVYSRSKFKLPPLTPRSKDGFRCNICGRGCILSNGETGYCGFRSYTRGSLTVKTGSNNYAIGLYYYDPHPTNCVAYSICPAVTGRGYPVYALTPRGERGYYNIAVFYGGCNLDCLYCQNWEYRRMTMEGKPLLSIDALVDAVNRETTCVCFFGGDPAPWSTHALVAAKKMIDKAKRIGLKVFRICWETNGLWNPLLFRKAVELSLETGGIVKVDFKAWTPQVYAALTGIDPSGVRIIRENIRIASEYFNKRRDPPLLVVSTLLVPGYIDDYEIDQMTRYVARLNTKIPYIFLGFHPDYLLKDLPRTSIYHAKRAVEIARRNGLENVYVENGWLLGNDYP